LEYPSPDVNLANTITIVAATIDLFTASLFVLALLRRPRDVENGVATLVCFVAGFHAAASLAALHADRQAFVVISSAGSIALLAALPTMAHFALVYGGIVPSRQALTALYGVAALCALVNALAPGRHGLFVDALGSAQRPLAMGSAGVVSYAAAIATSLGVIVIIGRMYRAGRKESLAVVLGASALLVASVNDLAVAADVLSTGYYIDAGLAAVVVAIMTTRSARFAAVTRELERRTTELRSRSNELRRSYEDLRTAQEELVKKEQLAVVGELAAVIAHEVRNPLAIIANAGAGLRKQSISRQDHETLLAILDEETSRLNRLVTDLLRYARPVNVQRSDFSLVDVLDRAIGLVVRDRKEIRAEFRVESHEGRIWGDPNLLRQVFDNLVVNAVQAMTAEGTLTVRVRAASVDGIRGVAVDIIDTGEGMDTQIRTRARDPFFTTRPSGTGLGLAIVDRIVDAHGGHLAIESRTGEGTTVTVFLPDRPINEPAPPRSHSSKPPPEAPGAPESAREG
jgi:signal transduction histidine kinase